MAEDRRRRPDYSGDGSNSPREGASDPLAELARLIGQSDPFAELGKRNPRKPLDNDRPAPEWLARSTPPERDESGYAPRTQAPYVPSYRPLPYQPPAHEDAGDYRPQPRSEYYDEQDRYADPAAHDDYQAEPAAYYEGDEQNPPDDRYRVAPPSGGYDADAYYAEDGHMPPEGEETIIGPRRRGGVWTIAAVLGLAVIGTAGALGYRAFTSGTSAPANPPVIKADPTPPKSVPTPLPQASADTPTKPFQDRVAAPTERVVPREEQPVSLPITPPTPRVTTPQPSAQSVAPLITPPMPTTVSEPKKVKTVTIRQDSTGDDAALASAPAAQAPAASARTPATKQPTAITPSVDPRSKVAARTPPAAAGGAYVVQVSAQRTEAEAQSSYEALQTKYPSVLGSRSASIRRVDLGDKGGIFYRAQVGNFPSSEQATAFCNSLKDAGGQCIVQKN